MHTVTGRDSPSYLAGQGAALAAGRLRETVREREHMRAAPHRSPRHMPEARTGTRGARLTLV